jgi:DMSO/TMAO reductase YedYZ heme-binding membrane subunit
MIVAIFAVLLTLAAMYGGKFIRKHNVKIYIVFTVVSVVMFVLQGKAFATPFIQGFLGLSFYYLVMVTGALKKGSKLQKNLMGLRREFSILGFITILPHATKYLLEWLNGDIKFPIFGVIGFVLMIPLFITSFQSIRKHMTQKSWKRLQSVAYVIYILLFIHLIINYTEKINLILYLVLFVSYFIMKITFEIKKLKEKQIKEAKQKA